MMMTPEALATLGIDESWSQPLELACTLYDITLDHREAMFIAQCAHESGGFKRLVENLNYSPAGLLRTFPKYFSPAQSVEYAHDGERIANRAYAFRMGNGDEESGDGWKYRGRGLIQLTGRTAYLRCGRALDRDLIGNPDLLTEPEYAAQSAAWFWSTNGCNELADARNFAGITRRINGGLNGQDERMVWLGLVEKAMA